MRCLGSGCFVYLNKSKQFTVSQSIRKEASGPKMMRNCFKRQGASNIDFNSLNSGPQNQPQGSATNTQPHQSPLIKSSANGLKQQKSTTINPSMHNTYILPATTQSRTLQYQQQQKLNLQLKSQGHLVQSNSNSKSTSNIHQHSTGNLAQASGNLLTSPDAGAHGPSSSKPGSHHNLARPESGKKRTSYLMHSHGSQGQFTQSSASAHGKLPATSQGNLLVNNQYSSEVLGASKQAATSGHESQNPSFITSPPKRPGQTRKPSGKSTKSNRAALAKKQLITHSSQIFPQNGVQQSHVLQSGVTTSANVSHVQQPSNVTSPVLAKINANNKAQAFQEIRERESQGKNASNAHSSGSKHQSFSQPRLASAKQNNASGPQNDNGTQSSYILSKNQIDFRKSQGGQHRNQGKESFTPSSQNHYSGSEAFGAKHDVLKQGGLQASNSVQVLSAASKSQSLVEHGAVAAVIPSQNGTSGNKNAQSSRSNGSQQFLPTIQSNSSTNKSQAMCAATSISPYHSVEEVQQNVPNAPIGSNQAHLAHLSNQTPASDYFNLKQSQTAKYGGQGNNGAAIRSTSQPHLQKANSHQQSQNIAPSNLHQSASFVQPGSGVSQGTVGASTASSAQQQMNNLLGKGLRSQSEPPQPQLKPSDSTASFMENLRQRATFSVVMKAQLLPKQKKKSQEKLGTEAQMASDSVKATVTKLLQKNQPQSTLPFFQTSKVSAKAFGSVKAFAANTNVGIVRKANEDRISIILNVIQPAQKNPRIPSDQWPKLQIFGVYDGHGGSKCAEYLKDNLHNNIILEPTFPSNIPEAIRLGSYKTEDDYLKVAAPSPDQPHNKAGSCAIVILVVDEDVYILNVGDSRAMGSESIHPSDSFIQTKTAQAVNDNQLQSTPQVCMEAISNVRQLSDDHKPSCPKEFKRILAAGGYVYQTQTVMKNGLPTTQTQQVKQDVCPGEEDSDDEENPFVGPYRVFPGRLSVCRTFGDCEAKLAHLGGVQGVVTCDPETTHEVNGTNQLDYVLIGSDGVFDKLKNDTINQIIWDVTTQQRQIAHSQGQMPSLHTISGLVADEVLHASAKARSLDNLSVVFVAFKRFKDYIESMQNQEYFPSPMDGIKALATEQQLRSSVRQTPNRNENVRRTSQNDKQSLTAKNNHLNLIQSQDGKALQKNSNSVYKLEQTNALQQQPYSTNKTNNMSSSFKAGTNIMDNGQGENKRGLSANGPQEGAKTPNNQNQFYLTKIREQQQQMNQRQNMLDNINRPSSRQGASRKGGRSRKSNNTGLPSTAAGSHSQDSRSTLPQVSSQHKPGAQSKMAYSQLQEGKGSGNSQSTASLPTALGQQQLSQGGANASQSTQNIHHGQAYPSAREQINSQGAPNGQPNRRGGLFKVNAQSHALAANGQSQGAGANANNVLPDFIKPGSKTMANSSNTSQIVNSSSNGNSGKMGTMDGGAAGDGTASTSSRQLGQGNARKKMKPYKSSQIRRMPDNSANLPLKYITEAGTSASGSKARDTSQGAFSANNQATGNHRF